MIVVTILAILAFASVLTAGILAVATMLGFVLQPVLVFVVAVLFIALMAALVK